VHFAESATTLTIRLVPTARVTVLPSGPNGPVERQLRPDQLPTYISSGTGSHIFAVTGSAGAATALTEQYRP
jgi:glutamate-1-semialdehyde aminotransferase